METSASRAAARRAAHHWTRIRRTMRVVEPDWPRNLPGAVEGVKFGWTLRHERPFVRIGEFGYMLVDEAAEPEADQVLEVGPGRSRVICASGRVRVKRHPDASSAELN